jgi:phenylacetate-CoA ligase
MKDLTPLPGSLGPIEGTSRDEITVLQIQRLKSSLVHAYANVRFYRQAFDAAGVHRRTCRSLLTSPAFVSPAKPICEPTALRHDRCPTRWGCAHPCLIREQYQPIVVGYTAADLANWCAVVAGSLRARGLHPGSLLHNSPG